MTKRNSLTAERLRELLHYDPGTGIFTWLVRRGKAHVGSIAGTKHPHGYLALTADRHPYLLHRLAWFWVYGVWPIEVDHRDRVKTNNRIENLRVATRQQNLRNNDVQANNTSGVTGVSWHKKRKKWRATITVDSKLLDLGMFDALMLAQEARAQAEIKHFGDFRAVRRDCQEPCQP